MKLVSVAIVWPMWLQEVRGLCVDRLCTNGLLGRWPMEPA